MPVLRSDLLLRHGFRHAFSLRGGGVSDGPFASLNLGRAVGDDPARVDENGRRFAAALEAPLDRMFEVSQVHGVDVAQIGPADGVSSVRAREADALVAVRAGDAVGVRTADCMPLLIADPERGAVAAVHAGWRGLAAGVIVRAIDALLGDRPADALLVAIGSHIRADAFEVSGDVAAQIAASAPGAAVIDARSPRPHADLAKAAIAQLTARGVRRIDDVGGCTFAEPARFFSHRRDAGRTGRHLAAIVAR